MSVFITKPAWESNVESPTHRLVMLALADHADPAGYCYPSIGRLCRMTGLSESSVKRSIRHLEALGILARAPRLTPAGDRTSNGYRFSKARLSEMRRPDADGDATVDEHPMADLGWGQ